MTEIQYDAHKREIVSRGTNQFPLAVYQVDTLQSPVLLHWHDEFETGYVVEGGLCVTVGTEKYTLRKNDGFFINAQALHAISGIGEEPAVLRSVVFSPSVVGGRADSVFWQRYCVPLLATPSITCIPLDHVVSWQNDCIEAIRRAWECTRSEYAEYELNTRYMLSHLQHMLCTHLPVRVNLPGEKANRDNERIKRMLSYIHENYQGQITVGDVAACVSISQSECLRCFHDTIGTTPVRYIRDYRIQRAAELLTSTDLTIADIADRCGFQDLSYFTRTFRESRKLPPAEFRRHR